MTYILFMSAIVILSKKTVDVEMVGTDAHTVTILSDFLMELLWGYPAR